MTSKLVILILYFLFFGARSVLASSVVLNELMPHPSPGSDWIELYNPTNTNIDLSNWILVDSTSTMKTLSGIISSNGFFTIDVTNRLNNSGDSVYLKDSSGVTIDNYSYNSDPGINTTLGRSPDGGEWTSFATSSKGSSNGEPSPTPTSTPTPSPTPTPTPKPTAKPIPLASPIPTHTPAPAANPSVTPKSTIQPSTVNQAVSSNQPVRSDQPKPTEFESPAFAWARRIASSGHRIASVAGVESSATPEAKIITETKKQTNYFIIIGWIFVIIGIGSLGFIIYKISFPKERRQINS